MKLIVIALICLTSVYCDSILEINHGAKAPSEGNMDVYIKYSADAARTCVVALKNPANGWYTHAKETVACPGGTNKIRGVTLKPGSVPVGSGYVIEVKLLADTTQTAYLKKDVTISNGKQGFHTWNGKLFDASKQEFIIRGINNAHGDFDNFDRNDALNALDNIAATKANAVRILYRKKHSDPDPRATLSLPKLDGIISKCISLKMIPIVELHDATGSQDDNKLLEMAQFWADNVWLLIKYRKHIIVNIANEWSDYRKTPEQWKNAYQQAIAKIRNAGFSGTLMIDAPAYAQNPNGPKQYGQALYQADPVHNLIFSIHMYAEWSSEHAPNTVYNIDTEMNAIKSLNIPFVVGEFAHLHHAEINHVCKHVKIDAVKIMNNCARLGFGYLGWSWNGNGEVDGCGKKISINYLDIAANHQWEATSYSTWGNILINTAGVGIRDSAKVANVFFA
jgi:mannan endo-1,4-beta-mannosidase